MYDKEFLKKNISLINKHEKTKKEYLKKQLSLLFKDKKNHCQYVKEVTGCSYDTAVGYFKTKGNKIPLKELMLMCISENVDIEDFLQKEEGRVEDAM